MEFNTQLTKRATSTKRYSFGRHNDKPLLGQTYLRYLFMTDRWMTTTSYILYQRNGIFNFLSLYRALLLTSTLKSIVSPFYNEMTLEVVDLIYRHLNCRKDFSLWVIKQAFYVLFDVKISQRLEALWLLKSLA